MAEIQKKRKKRKRKLKKSVKRGCSSILLIVLLVIGFFTYRSCKPQLLERLQGKEKVAIQELPPDSLDKAVAAGIKHLLDQPQRVRTDLLGISVYDLDRNCSVYEYHSDSLMPPASCMKLLTAIHALHSLGVDHQYVSEVSMDGTLKSGILNGALVVSMDDDPLIENFNDFADSLLHHGVHQIDGLVQFDLARTDTLKQHPTAKPWDIPYRKLPILMKGEKRVKAEFIACLQRHQIVYHPDSLMAISSDGDSKPLFQIKHPLRDVIAPMLIFSSNIKAESVFYHTRHVLGMQGEEMEDTTLAVEQFLQEELPNDSIDGFVLNDGSGLSPDNRLTARFLVHLLTYAYRDKDLHDVLIDEALATPAHPTRRGSLTNRMTSPRFVGHIFCKTGTLTTIGASSLSGYCKSASGRWFAFSIINNDSPVYESRAFQDQVCRVLVSKP